MARAINQVILMGRLTRDPEMRTTPNGKNVTSFSLAVDRPGSDDSADFFDITAWEKTGELVNQYLSKGRRCLVQGRLSFRSWEQDGQKRSKVEVIANDVTFLDGPNGDNNGSGSSNSGSSAPSSNKQTKDVAPEDIDDKPIDLSEIPF
ncbi:MAG: single-strand binding protein [Candidatus Saccharibacteria bacterium GW2011_GWC2_48_9]|nr:MAG: single-strand binding protein [Candidatus Saccharibacteria bacterium GW2011_GWC2_48_9]HCH34436.1 single-stranded DNA-binding protein [Candidatus Saccharibacteria bacterium]